MFKRNFERMCTQKGVAPSTVMRQCGMAAATYSCWTEDTIPRQSTVKKLADYLGCTIDDLLADEPIPKKETLPAEAGSADIIDLDGVPDYVKECIETALKIPPDRREDFLRVAREIAKTFEPRE